MKLNFQTIFLYIYYLFKKNFAINLKTWYISIINNFSERSEPSGLSFMYGGLWMSGKKSGNTTQRVYELAKPLADSLGLDLWDIRFEKEGSNWYLRVFIDKDGGVSIDECEALSRPLNIILDETDPIEQSYIFEVSSPGLGRELKKAEHFEKFLGQQIRIKLYHAVNGNKEFTGVLLDFSKNLITLEASGQKMEIALSDCAFVRLFDDDDLFN